MFSWEHFIPVRRLWRKFTHVHSSKANLIHFHALGPCTAPSPGLRSPSPPLTAGDGVRGRFLERLDLQKSDAHRAMKRLVLVLVLVLEAKSASRGRGRRRGRRVGS